VARALAISGITTSVLAGCLLANALTPSASGAL
jgi:hypothetical protein